MRVITGFVIAAAVAASAVGCMSGGNNGNGLIPVPGTPPQKTEVFSGTVTMTSAGPPSTVVMGIGLGLGTATTCQLQIAKNAAAGDAPQIAASQVPASSSLGTSYCVGIGDVGNATGPVTFSITVIHT